MSSSSWFSPTGVNKMYTQQEPESEDEKKKRQEQAANRLPGSAGYGSMFTQTNGGAQRTYNPISAGGTNNNQVGRGAGAETGRTAPASIAEQARQQSLQNILGKVGDTGTQDTLLNKLGSIDTSLNDTKKRLGSITPENTEYGKKLTSQQLNLMLQDQLTSDVNETSDIEAVIKKMAEDSVRNIAPDITAMGLPGLRESITGASNEFKDLGMTPQMNLEDATAKEKAGYAMALNRLKAVGSTPSINTFNDKIGESNNLLSNIDLNNSTISGIVDTLAPTLGNKAVENFSGANGITTEFSAIQDILQKDRLNKMLQNMYTSGSTDPLMEGQTIQGLIEQVGLGNNLNLGNTNDYTFFSDPTKGLEDLIGRNSFFAPNINDSNQDATRLKLYDTYKKAIEEKYSGHWSPNTSAADNTFGTINQQVNNNNLGSYHSQITPEEVERLRNFIKNYTSVNAAPVTPAPIGGGTVTNG